MPHLANVRENIGKWLLMRSFQNEKSEMLKSMKQTKNIGIVYNATDFSAKELTKVVHFFEAEGKQVKTLGYVDAKEKRDEHLSHGSDVFFSRKELSFWLIPKGEEVEQFLKEEFDFLINLDCKGLFPLQAISAKSNAKIKMAKYLNQYEFAHDFMASSNTMDELELFNDLKKYILNDE